MRADAQRNYERMLDVARVVVAEQGADASLRDVARRAEVGLGTLYRHFPTREALLAALLRASFDELSAQADDLIRRDESPREALATWLRDCVAFSCTFRGVTTVMMAAIEDPASALHTSCVSLRSAGALLLHRAQAAGQARGDLDGTDLFDLIAALAWLGDQPSGAGRADRHFDVIASAILTPQTIAVSAPE